MGTKILVCGNGMIAGTVGDGHVLQAAVPIGLAIKVETPEEIAISIAGELIQLRAEKAGSKK